MNTLHDLDHRIAKTTAKISVLHETIADYNQPGSLINLRTMHADMAKIAKLNGELAALELLTAYADALTEHGKQEVARMMAMQLQYGIAGANNGGHTGSDELDEAYADGYTTVAAAAMQELVADLLDN